MSPGGGTLYVVATPIGNLGDVTLRALEVLRTVPLVAAEDTRRTRKLLDRYGASESIRKFRNAVAFLVADADGRRPGRRNPGGLPGGRPAPDVFHRP